jgi:hypothetical protein
MSTDRHTSDNTDEILRRVAAIEASYVTQEALDERIAEMTTAFDQRMERQTVDIVHRVSATQQAMVQDAIRTALQEQFASIMQHEFARLWTAQRDAERAERREDIQQAFGKIKVVILYILPFLTALNIVLNWLGVFG